MSGAVYKKTGSEILVNQLVDGNQEFAEMAALENGNFVVTWQDSGNSIGFGTEIKAQIFDAAGGKVGGEFLVNTSLTGNQQKPVVTGLTNGNFVIAWNDGRLFAQLFDPSGQKVGSQQTLFQQNPPYSFDTAITKLAGGGFVVGYTLFDKPTIELQFIDNNGLNFSSNTLVPYARPFFEAQGDVAGLRNGGFVLA